MWYLLTAAVLALGSDQPAFARQAATEALPAVKEAGKAAGRAEDACHRNQADKCLLEARATVDWMARAVVVLDRSAEPEPEPEPEPGHGHAASLSHRMPDPPAFEPLGVADVTPLAVITDPLPYVGQVPVPPSAAPDVVGAFRFVCNVSHLAYDDPIMFPRQPGKSHLHMFFGNTGTDASSDYASLRMSGGGSCQADVLNRSAYWIPALLDGPLTSPGTSVVVPDFIGLYYKRLPASDPECQLAGERCAGIPAGLRAIFGTNYARDHRESPHVRFDCNGDFSSQKLAEVADRCRDAPHIYARVDAPDCWDGKRLDSENHQDHMAYMFYDGTRSSPRCPRTHPVVIPKLSLIVAYAVLPGDRPESWIFSSDAMAGAEPGTTFHADYMEAWEPEVRLTWEANCIDKLLSCSGGDLGNGHIMREPEGFTFEQRPHLLKPPAR